MFPASRLLTVLAVSGLAVLGLGAPANATEESRMNQVIPAPVSVTPDRHGGGFEVSRDTVISVDRAAKRVGDYLAGVLRPSTGYRLPVVTNRRGGINLTLGYVPARLGSQGYELTVNRQGVTLKARTTAGLFSGVQTLRQLLPARVESRTKQRGPWTVAGGRIVDYPRFAYRGAMLDVSRHFFSPTEVKTYIDQIAPYKINYLHLHLADDQGWRIQIDGWPRLTEYGGSTEVGGGPGGFYTKAQFRDLVSYAVSRGITLVPEIDMPGHTNAALASYPELNCDGVAPPLYTGTEVGFSSLCIDKDITYRFLHDVITQLAELTPGPYLHIGGDEAHATSEPDYIRFFDRVFPIVQATGKTMSGWHDYLKATPPVPSVAQFWGTEPTSDLVSEGAAAGHKVLLSPANKAYIDMKYDANTPLGLSWAGFTEVDDAYDWNPGAYVENVPESAVLGVEAPLWAETLENSDNIEFMAFPRLPAIAELGWSPWSTHDWTSFRTRLAAQGPRWEAMGVDFYRSPQIPW